VMMSRSHQKLADLQTEVSRCLGSPQCSCSQCNLEAAFGSFTMADFQALKCEPAKRLSQSSAENIAYLGDGHRCKRFPCPICNPGRSQRDGLSSVTVTAYMLDWSAQGVVPQQLRRHGREQAAAIMLGDGGHTCRRFPCPICNNGRSRSAVLEVHVGC
jgi:hypothetical protein